MKKEEKTILGSIKIKQDEHFLKSNRKFYHCNTPHQNDCWNVALSLATEKNYEDVRKGFKGKISRDGGLRGFYSHKSIQDAGYVSKERGGFKTVQGLARGTKGSGKEYIVSTSGHLLYVRNGIIFDTHASHLRRIVVYYEREIRNPVFLKGFSYE